MLTEGFQRQVAAAWAAKADMADLALTLAGCEAVLDPAGALYLPESRAVVVADLHLEKASSLARSRLFLPPYDSAATLALLERLIARRRAGTVICLGDSFHDRGGAGRLGASEAAKLAELRRGRDWIWVAGNHDPELSPPLAGEVVPELRVGGLTLRHEPRPGAAPGEVAGHLHPAARLRRGGGVRRRAFVGDGTRLVLPAFGVLAGGLNVLDRAFRPLFSGAFLAFMLGERRVYAVSPTSLAPD